jgi:hypothetical protein
VKQAFARAGKLVLACLILSGFGALGFLGASLGTTLATGSGSLRVSAFTPAEVIAARFPSADASLPEMSPSAAASGVVPAEMFSPSLYALASYAAPATDSLYEPAYPDQAKPVATIPAAAAKIEPPKPQMANNAANQVASVAANPVTSHAANQAAVAAARRAANRPSNVLNDAQISNIKRRLNLTPDQERMWPAVETALRRIVYTKHAAEARVQTAQAGTAPMAYVDPTSEEVQQLKYAALPLIMRLNDDQRREVKMIAHVMGLEGVASQF